MSFILPSAPGKVTRELFVQDPTWSKRWRLSVLRGDAGMLRKQKGTDLMLRELTSGNGKSSSLLGKDFRDKEILS